MLEFRRRLPQLVLEHHEVRRILVRWRGVPYQIRDLPRGLGGRFRLEAFDPRPEAVVRASPQAHGHRVPVRRLEEPAAEGVVVARAPRELGLAPAELGLEVGQARVAAGDAQLERLAAAVVVVVVTPPRTMPIAAAAVPVGEQGGGGGGLPEQGRRRLAYRSGGRLLHG